MLGVWTVASAVADREAAVFCAALAKTLACMGKRVLTVELCLTSPALDLALGVAERVVYTLTDVAARRVSPERALLPLDLFDKKGEPTDARGTVLFLPAEAGASWDEEAGVQALSDVIGFAGADVAFLLAEGKTLSLARRVSDGALLLTDGSADGLRAACALCEGTAFNGFVLSHFIPTTEAVRGLPSLTALADTLSLPLVGILPESGVRDAALAPKRKDFTAAVRNIACRIAGQSAPLLSGIPIDGMRKRTYFERL